MLQDIPFAKMQTPGVNFQFEEVLPIMQALNKLNYAGPENVKTKLKQNKYEEAVNACPSDQLGNLCQHLFQFLETLNHGLAAIRKNNLAKPAQERNTGPSFRL
jgi:hypothetical protein